MKNYLKRNSKTLIFLLVLVILSGPVFSAILSWLSGYLNQELGDWLSFYGAISGIVISLLVIHFQLSIEEERKLRKNRPIFILENDYQLVKTGNKVYFSDKFWFHLEKLRDKNTFVTSNSFEQSYVAENKRDKALSIEILNNQPVFNLCILFGNGEDYVLIPRLGVEEKIYIISKKHMEAIHNYLNGKSPNFNHVPQTINLYYTTLAGEVISSEYSVDDKGYCQLEKQRYDTKYPSLPAGNHLCDYFIMK